MDGAYTFTASKSPDCFDGPIVLMASVLRLKGRIGQVGGPRKLGLLPIPQPVTLQALPK